MNAVLRPDPNDLLLAALQCEPLLRALLWRYTRNRSDVEELLQDVYAKLLTARPRHYLNVKGYVLTTAANTAREWLSHRKCVCIELLADVDELEHLDEHALVEEVISSQQELQLLIEAIQQLTEHRRRVFVLKKIYGYTQAQIAARMKIAEHTVEVHMHQAIRHLALILGSRLP
jgi:RNA polymerase sigma-70 factor (ECF subfamily)